MRKADEAEKAAASAATGTSQAARILVLAEENRRLREHLIPELEEKNRRLREHAHAAV